ncbi:MAG: MarR family transcriptional regulator [Sphaerochaetaceae bacterium]|nr:MarR family transcriptional regulator [Sphaerochaetaceae bacterium]
MKLEWLGDYRNLIESLIRYTNVYAQVYNIKGFHDTKVKCSLAQIQVLEYVLENEEKNLKMAENAKRLGISPSAFSKNVKNMENKGLLEKYCTNTNKKEIIIKTTDLGREVYNEYTTKLQKIRFDKTFEILNQIPVQYINKFEELLNFNAESMLEQKNKIRKAKGKKNNSKIKLIKINTKKPNSHKSHSNN